jgi:hypothetical protein
VRAEPGCSLSEGVDRDTAEPFPQLIGGAETEVAQLIETTGAGLTSRAKRHHQHPDRLHVAIGGLRHAVRASAQRGAGCFDGIDAVGLAVTASGLAVGAIDLDHRHTDTA